MDTAWTWELSGYCAKYSFLTKPKGLTMREVERIFQLDPEPPVRENLNDYILEAVQSRDLPWFSFFLHHYENRLNGRVRRFLLREGLDRYDPERFLDYKMGCVLALLDCLWEYDPTQGTDFLTYAHHFIGNALLTCRMQEEAGSFENVDEYKAVRGIAWLYNQSGESEQAAIQKYAQKNGCTDEELAVLFEGSTASGAERAYRKAVEHLACLLAEAGVLHMIRLKRKSQIKRKKKIAAAVYLYQVDNDGEWGEISFDFEARTAEITQLAEWDTIASKKFAQKAIQYILTCDSKLCKETTLIYE